MNIASSALLFTLAAAAAAEPPPAHIVQDLPREPEADGDRGLAPPPAIVREIDEAEARARAAAFAPLDPSGHESAAQQAWAASEAENAKVETAVRGFLIAAQVQKRSSGKAKTRKAADAPAIEGETEITCADGLYFDMEEGVLVFIREVRLRNPTMSLDCDNQLKVFLEKRDFEERKKGEKAASSLDNVNVDFSDARLITADGNVILRRLDAQGRWMEARGEKMSYDVKTKETILTGGRLFLSYGDSSSTFEGPGAFIRIYANGSAYVKGAKNKIHLQDLDSFKSIEK